MMMQKRKFHEFSGRKSGQIFESQIFFNDSAGAE